MTDGAEGDGASAVDVDVLDERVVGASLVRVLRVRDVVGSLEGHFPGSPVVPGIVQVQWALDAVRRLTQRTATVDRLEALKFKAVIRPGQRVEVVVELCAVADVMRFRISCGETVFASGRCVLRPASSPVP